MRNNGSRWLFAVAFALAVGAMAAAGSADVGPVPVDPSNCVSLLPALTTSCPQQSHPQAASVSSAQGMPLSKARSFSVSAALRRL